LLLQLGVIALLFASLFPPTLSLPSFLPILEQSQMNLLTHACQALTLSLQ
jgi:hypothetical protein